MVCLWCGRTVGGRAYGHLITNFLGWVDYFIFLAMVLPRARFARESFDIKVTADYLFPDFRSPVPRFPFPVLVTSVLEYAYIYKRTMRLTGIFFTAVFCRAAHAGSVFRWALVHMTYASTHSKDIIVYVRPD